MKVLALLKGKKTYIIAAIAAVYAIGIEGGFWQHQAWLDVLLAALGTGTMRLAIQDAIGQDKGITGNGGNFPQGNSTPQP